MADKLKIHKMSGNFEDRYKKITVYEVTGGGFSAFVYQCTLNLDIDGSPLTYGLDNPAAKNSAGDDNQQKNLDPLENWHKGVKGVSTEQSQRGGLGNACGDPGDGSKGWSNFLNGNRIFYWAGVQALTKTGATGYVIDDRPELEAGLDQNYSGYFQKHGKLPNLLAKGSGYFPVVQGKGSPAPGYYVSTTSVVGDGDKTAFDQNRYLDATKVPYAVWANEWAKWSLGGKKVDQGDFGIAIRTSTGANTGYVYGDSGTATKVGECSQKMQDALGGSSDLVSFIAFPGSGSGRVLGANPQNVIRGKVVPRSTSLKDNASDLAMFLATGLVNPKTMPKLTTAQARGYNNAYAALCTWTVP